MQVLLVLINDEAYRPLLYLLKPFGGKNVNDAQEILSEYRLQKKLSSVLLGKSIPNGVSYQRVLKLTSREQTTLSNVYVFYTTISLTKKYLKDIFRMFPNDSRRKATGRPTNEAKIKS